VLVAVDPYRRILAARGRDFPIRRRPTPRP